MSSRGDVRSREPACWCGVKNPYYEPLRGGCDGYGYLECLCGGDFCVCHNHGEVECFGCGACQGGDDGDDYRDDGEEVGRG